MEDLPEFVREQQRLAADPLFKAKLCELGQKIPAGKRRTLFISHAWNLEPDKDPYKEQWVDAFVDQMAKDLKVMGFDVFLDKKRAGVGVHLKSTMEDEIRKTDHVLLVLTHTYFYKTAQRPMSGVSQELDYILDKIEKVGGTSAAGELRFLIPFLLVPRIPGFSLVESYSGFAGTHLKNVGYENALLDLANKIYLTDEPLKPFVEKPAEFAQCLKTARQELAAAYIKDHETEGDAVAESMGGDAVLENVRSKGDQTSFSVDGGAAIFGGRSGGNAHALHVDSTASSQMQAAFDKYRVRK